MADVRFRIVRVWGEPGCAQRYLLPALFHICSVCCMGLVLSLLFATLKSLMQIITHDIDDLLITGAPIHSINEHLADGHHTITYKTTLTCKCQRALQAESSRSICAVTALNCVRLAFQLEAKEGVEGTILRSFLSEETMNVSTLFNFSCGGNLTIY